jgi:hypothetical protein
MIAKTFSQAVANLPNPHPVAVWWEAHWHTQLIELPIYVVLLWWAFRRWWIVIPLSVFVNIVTHPTLWYLVPYWDLDGSWLGPLLTTESHRQHASYLTWLIVAECGVFLIEGHIIAAALINWGRDKYQNAPFAIGYGVLCAFIANVPSTLWGLLD